MLRIGKCLVLASLFIGTGCTDTEKRPEPPKKSVSSKVKPADVDVPVAVSKLLPTEQVNEKNAHAQAQIMFNDLSKEKGNLERTESAKRE